MDMESLFLIHMDQLYRVAFLMLNNKLDAEDAVQETYIRLLMKKPVFRDEEHGKAWLLRVCINICKNQIRFRKRHLAEKIEKYDVAVDSIKEWEVLQALSSLPIKLREPIVLSTLAGYTIRETAEILGITEAAVKKRIQRGREKLDLQLGGIR